ncbi:autophagy-related protein 13 homolog [Trichonephila inaurata madagascariensis]|uniref:Autophagy-related protein 13 n=1 Tax=Trichonephila inaurata madagascariensis TaxID=2747483 RepID=A0A8X6X6C2_9ARAC|nr:autophagy-related protein 13 homolog [Trichonephila inaurata madagascariensis]
MSQVIVQSRFGEKIPRSSKRNSVHEWFNLAIEDNVEIQSKAKDACSKVQLLKDFCICTEILLKTADGDTLVLETWSLSMNTSDCISDTPYMAYTSLASVYCRMTLLLKSIIAVTRMTPAFKLSTCQSANTYVILFRIYSGEPQVQELGEHYIKSKIGQVLTPVGTLKVSILYRSKDNLTITPQEVDKGNPFMLKSDYFKPDINSKISHSDGYKYEENSAGLNAIGDFQKIGAFALPNNLQDITFPELDMLEKPFLNLSRSKLQHTNKLKDDSNKNADKNANMDQIDNKENSSGVDYNCNSNDECCQQKTFQELFDSGDFLLMETKPPFADYDGDNDIGAFFRECQSAPPLASFSVQPTLEEQVTDIASQLAKFETSMNDFDNFVDSICHLDIAK